jgi:hypothetical protein
MVRSPVHICHHKEVRMRIRLMLVLALGAAIAMVANVSAASAVTGTPTGERLFHQSSIEPAYDAATGNLGFLLTPIKAPDPVKSNPRSWAPIYLPVYPTSSTVPTPLNCMHTPAENCPSHGDLVAGAAQQISTQAGFGDVYVGGVLGHDHVADFPGGDDFNIAWEPVLVLFKTADAANTHLTTDAAILDAAAAGTVMLAPAPGLTFTCAVVPATIWNRASS